jgi:hypothetical protein
MDSPEFRAELDPILARSGRRIRSWQSLSALWRWLWLGPALGLVGLALGRFMPLPGELRLALGLALAGTILPALLGWIRRPSPEQVARRIDAILQLDDRLATALYLASEPPADGRAAPWPGPFDRRQQRDALASLARAERSGLWRQQRPRPLRSASIAAALLTLAALVLIRLPNPMRDELARREAVRIASQQAALGIEEVARGLGEARPGPLADPLDQLATALSSSRGRLEEDLRALSEAEAALRSDRKPSLLAQAEDAAGLRRELAAWLAADPEAKAGDASDASAVEVEVEVEAEAEVEAEVATEAEAEAAAAAAAVAKDAARAGPRPSDLADRLSALAERVASHQPEVADALRAAAEEVAAAEKGTAEKAASDSRSTLDRDAASPPDTARQAAAAAADASLSDIEAAAAEAQAVEAGLSAIRGARESIAAADPAAGPAAAGEDGSGKGLAGEDASALAGRQAPGADEAGSPASDEGAQSGGLGAEDKPLPLPPVGEGAGAEASRRLEQAGPARFLPAAPPTGPGRPSGPGLAAGPSDSPSRGHNPLPPGLERLPEYRDAAGLGLAREDLPPALRDYVRAYFDALAADG